MEKYKVLQRLGKGGQGSVYLVEQRKSGAKYVMKKVECKDESEANKAFHEAMTLHDLPHPYVCAYKEFFVTWDKEDRAMFVCIVMQYYPQGDLSLVLKKRRESSAPIDELLIKKWLGQIIEALVYVHKKKVIHRDLKSSNIFMTDDMSVCIGDFGVATIMGDVRTRTRTVVGSMNWMAPEVLDRPYDERSDVWSAGCILLEMTTCAIIDQPAMFDTLNEIKHSQESLEALLEDLGKTYSAEIVSLIRIMLRRNFNERPSSEELVEIPYVRECLSLSGSVVTERRRRQSSAPPQGILPIDRGMMPVVEYLMENIGNEKCVKQALEYLSVLSKEDGATLDNPSKQIIIRAMQDYMPELKVQICGCSILNNLLRTAPDDDVVYSTESIRVIAQTMKTHASSAELQQSAISLLTALSADDRTAEVIGNVGGLQNILTAMRAFPDNKQLCTTCCSALWSLTVNEENARIMTEEKGLRDIVKVIRTHFSHPDLVEAGCATLLSLSIMDENMELMNDLDCAGLVVDAIKEHLKDTKVVKNGCMALTSLVEPDEECAFRVLMRHGSDGGEIPGIPIIVSAYEMHKDNADVVEAIASLIMELCEYDEILAEMKFLKIDETLLHEMNKRFKGNQEIMAPVQIALSKLAVGKSTS